MSDDIPDIAPDREVCANCKWFLQGERLVPKDVDGERKHVFAKTFDGHCMLLPPVLVRHTDLNHEGVRMGYGLRRAVFEYPTVLMGGFCSKFERGENP